MTHKKIDHTGMDRINSVQDNSQSKKEKKKQKKEEKLNQKKKKIINDTRKSGEMYGNVGSVNGNDLKTARMVSSFSKGHSSYTLK